MRDLQTAADHSLYTFDIYFHQTQAADDLRKIRKDPTLGKAPEPKGPMDGKTIQVFDPDDDSHAPIWDEHQCSEKYRTYRTHEVLRFIDNQHAESTYDDRYCAVYDDRAIRPGNLEE